MSKSLFIGLLFLVLLTHGFPVFADQYDDCLNDCGQQAKPCIEQAKLTAGNVQEEQDMIAACEKIKADCIQACKDAEAQPQPPPQEQQAPPPQEQQAPPPQEQQAPPPQEQQAPPPQEQQSNDTLNGNIKMYQFGK
jgi:outer membrane biosynthesis protein TonB